MIISCEDDFVSIEIEERDGDTHMVILSPDDFTALALWFKGEE
jgi:hypothetical protein